MLCPNKIVIHHGFWRQLLHCSNCHVKTWNLKSYFFPFSLWWLTSWRMLFWMRIYFWCLSVFLSHLSTNLSGKYAVLIWKIDPQADSSPYCHFRHLDHSCLRRPHLWPAVLKQLPGWPSCSCPCSSTLYSARYVCSQGDSLKIEFYIEIDVSLLVKVFHWEWKVGVLL